MNDCAAVTPHNESQVEKQMDRLSISLNDGRRLVEALHNRIGNILRSETPPPEDPDIKENDLTVHAESIKVQCDRSQESNAMLQNIIERVEL